MVRLISMSCIPFKINWYYRLQSNTSNNNDDDQNNSDIACFVQLWKSGVITQDELRRKVLQWTPVSPPPTLPRKRKLPSRVDIDDEIDKNVEAFNPAVALSPTTIPRPLKQKRPGKPTVTVGILRKLAKEPTRRRFFSQYCNWFKRS